jgi:hypothetical protein
MPAILAWLRIFDPDVIYSYVDLTPEWQLRLHEDLYPSSIQRHWMSGDGRPNYRPSIDISALTVATLVPVAAAPGAFGEAGGIRLFHAMGSMAQDRFLCDSFGFASSQLRQMVLGTLSDYASLMAVIADGELEPRNRHLRPVEGVLASAEAVLSAMAKDHRTTSLSQLSARNSTRFDLGSRPWSESFNIVIGDTVADRILYWNARALMSTWRDGGNVDLCIPRARLDSTDFVAALREFLKARNFVAGEGQGGTPQVTVRSTSIDEDALASISQQIRGDAGWMQFHHQTIPDLGTCVPDLAVTDRTFLTTEQRGMFASRGWSEMSMQGDEVRIAVPQPSHFRHAPSLITDKWAGSWAVDLDIERSVDHSRLSNIRHRWRFPRRLSVISAFKRHYQDGGPNNAIVRPRVSAGGLLTLFVGPETPTPALTIPSDSAAIVTGLSQGRDWAPFERLKDAQRPSQLCHYASRSSAGRHFWGVYQMFGDITDACNTLLHQFWRQQLAAYGATDQRPERRSEEAQAKLLKRLKGGQFDLKNPAQLQTLTNIVLQTADSERMTIQSRTWLDFRADFQMIVEAFNNKNPSHGEIDQAGEIKWQEDQLRDSIKAMCENGILHQGYEHKCKDCLHRSWIGIGALDRVISCEICGDKQLAPVDAPWFFRLNGFLRDALQRHGVGPLFWVLKKRLEFSRNSFWFEGPLDIYFDQESLDARRPATDIDLTMIDDGRVTMCEAKQSARQFNDPAQIAENMKRLRPDVALVAIMEPRSQALEQKFNIFSDVLAGTGITPELLTLDPETDISSDPFL